MKGSVRYTLLYENKFILIFFWQGMYRKLEIVQNCERYIPRNTSRMRNIENVS